MSPVPEIFISYRSLDRPVYATVLDRELGRRFGPDAVFLATRSIGPGDDFAEAILSAVRSAAAVVAVIGPEWSGAPGPRRPYGGVDDWVRLELAEAFAAGVRVVPVLVDGADLPVAAELPPELAPLTRCQAFRVTDDALMSDVDGLGAALTPLVEDRHRTGGRIVFGTGEPICRLGVVPGGIQVVSDVDVWVNSENTDLQMSRFTEFSVSAIIRYYGALRDLAGSVVEDLIADELRGVVRHTPVAPGTAVVTGAGALAAGNNVRYVVHVAAVQGEPGAGFRPVRNLGRCVRNALSAAEELAIADERVRSIIFPLLGTGVGGGPPERIAPVLVAAALDHFGAVPNAVLRTVWFLAYDRTERSALLRALTARPELTRVEAPS